MNRTPFTRNFGFTPARLQQMKENAENNTGVSNRFWWFKQPENVKNFNITEPGVYKFDVLQFPLKYSYHPYFAKQKIYDLGENPVWFDREVRVHSFGSHSSVCKRSFGNSYNAELKTFESDPVCEFMFADENRDKKLYQKTDKTFNVFVIRLHPNSPLGNTDYEIMTFASTRGIFAKKLYEEYEANVAVNDESVSFYRWDTLGKSLKARFVEREKNIAGRTVKWIECDKIDFFDRPAEISDAEFETIINLNIDDCISEYNEDACSKIVEALKKSETSVSSSPEESEDVKSDDNTFNEPAPSVTRETESSEDESGTIGDDEW